MGIIRHWGKPILILTTFFLIARLLPAEAIDPWQLFSLKKAAYMVFALVFIQTLGSAAIGLLGNRKGAVLTGFFGGLVSSTATTVELSNDSLKSPPDDLGRQSLTFISATLAMLFEGMVLLLIGTDEIHTPLLIIFAGPAAAAILMIAIQMARIPHRESAAQELKFEILPIVKLSGFIVGILAVSRLLQHFLGQSGLVVLTFLVSLFEIHGSVIANIQLHDIGAFDVAFLGGLLTLSISASFMSKLFLVWTIGSRELRGKAIRYSIWLISALFVSWLLFLALI